MTSETKKAPLTAHRRSLRGEPVPLRLLLRDRLLLFLWHCSEQSLRAEASPKETSSGEFLCSSHKSSSDCRNELEHNEGCP